LYNILNNFAYSLLGAVFFALFDYIGYNLSLRKNWVNMKFVNPYRISQSIVQVLITSVLLFFVSWQSALGFNIIWWSWGCDILFYFFCASLNIFKDRGNFTKQVIGNQVTWAWWTPYGLLFTKKQDTVKWQKLILQAAIGLALTFFISAI
jgi:hypothetical protein